jgi:hypothetical protein
MRFLFFLPVIGLLLALTANAGCQKVRESGGREAPTEEPSQFIRKAGLAGGQEKALDPKAEEAKPRLIIYTGDLRLTVEDFGKAENELLQPRPAA